ncbi:hypothetical protein OSH11_20825 [Kaistia dalseonensis]|uniref:Uncharacterized protein n=1 Tax=Kaistia dalseonensis TaxID=410840 RepID=A0ABU0HBV4_9HYPH|nr:hypothetical protein [Kaistia dalseonensis]MCX5497159.1 hypothetical protein [Kaistia dalseonensis]MDQ0439787.1 hypothetical protein [Kaistia dalseonensis]
MRFSTDDLDKILPRDLPPLAAVPGVVVAAYDELTEGDHDPLIRRSAFWTHAIFAALRRRSWSFAPEREIPPLLATAFGADGFGPNATLSVGALDPDFEEEAFGLVLTLPHERESAVIGTISLPELNDARFPVAVRALAEEPHAAPSLPNATTTCWAEDALSPGRWGFVTCSHALAGVATGASVPLVGGGHGTVLRKGWPLIDAALVQSASPTSILAPLPLVSFPTTGLTLSVHCGSGAVSRTVVGVTNTLGVLGDPHHPIKIYTDTPCTPGDSGSLITSAGDGAAIYCGALSGATVGGTGGQTVGFAQHLEQAAIILDFKPFQ